MTARLLFAVLLVAPSLALAQADDWSTFPAEPPPLPGAPVKPDDKPAPPKGTPGDSKADPKKDPRAAGKPSGMIPADPFAPPGGDPAASEPVVVSQEERFLPGGEPHSPSTWGNQMAHVTNRRVTPSTVGAVGLVTTSSAAVGPKGLLRFSVLGEYFTSREFPVQRAEHVRTAGTFAASFVPLEWLEAYLSYGASANSNSFASPTLIQTLGDVTLGAKVGKEWVKGLSAGLDLRAQSFSGVGSQDLGGYAWGFSPRAVATYDVRRAAPKVPLLFHLNAGVQLDGTGNLVRNHTLNPSEEFALGVNRYNRFVGAAGVEVPLPVVTPFLEYDVGVPLGVSTRGLESPDPAVGRVAVAAAMPQRLGLGLKITAVKDLTLITGAHLGLARTVGMGVPATPPWNVFLGAAFNVDPFGRGETRLVETVRERKITEAVAPPPRFGKVSGTVLDKETQKPIPGVIVAMVGAGLPPVASDADAGRFLTHELGEGPVVLVAAKDGYKAAQREVILAAGETTQVQLVLEPVEKKARFLVSVNGVSGKKKVPVAAEVKFKGPVEQAVGTEADVAEPKLQELPAGRYVVTVVAPEHLAQTREVQVTEDAEMKLHFDLEAQPKKKLVVVREDKIEILQQVHFATGKATILADSFGLLNQVVDAIVTNDVKRIRIEGHTDNRGGKQKNQTLSENRAQAVADYLVKQGIDPGRIETLGLGDGRPVAPNLTARGRELNRRVEFHIIER